MNFHFTLRYEQLRGLLLLIVLLFFSAVNERSFGQTYNFASSSLKSIDISNPTSLQFGPDGRLYVAQQNGIIKVFTIKKNGANNYSATATETINLINAIPNHNDDGLINLFVFTRQVTSLLVTGTAAAPILYVTSSDSRIGGPNGDLNLDTNSGILSRLTKTKTGWDKVDLIRGFPRSEENHATNGMQLDAKTNTLYLAIGGFTNAGAPSTNFAYICEYALSAAIVSIDLTKIDAMPTLGLGNTKYKYDLPTVDDPTRLNDFSGNDIGDPFGGNNGLNQAKIVANGPVQIHSSGYRNAYDLVITKTPGKERRMYTVDNGPNQGWGGGPDKEGSKGTATNNYVDGEPGSNNAGVNDPQVNNMDGLHYIGNLDTYVPGSYYGGHPNPIRANPSGAGLYTRSGGKGIWRSSKTGLNPLPADWPPVPVSMANPIEGDYQSPGEADKSLMTFPMSTNGLAEYTASNFNNALKGYILAACYNGNIYMIKPNAAGTGVLNSLGDKRVNKDATFASNFGSEPLDITAQGDNDIFPGTVWAATYGANGVTIFEPADVISCSGTYSKTLDDDKDGYSNADEIDNKTNPCLASSKPSDFDGDYISDLNDTDDDNDGILDNVDYFSRDAKNGLNTKLPLKYDLFNNDPGTGFFGLGFTGLMSNKKAMNDYLNEYDEDNLIAGGAVGAFSVVQVSSGDAWGSLNTQENAFQFGVNVNSSSLPFVIKARILGSFFNNDAPQNDQSQGIYIGTGDQDNYLKIVLNANGGVGGIQVVNENAGTVVATQLSASGILKSTTVDLILEVNPSTGIVQPRYAMNGGTSIAAGAPIKLAGALLTALQGAPALAIGIISTSKNASAFTATWDFIDVSVTEPISTGSWKTTAPTSGIPIGREENAYVQAGDKFYLLGGRTIQAVQEYDPITKVWTNKAKVPMELHHFQAVVLDGLIYVVGAFTGGYPHETPVPDIYIYNPTTNIWYKGGSIPAARRRGSAGIIVYNKKIYLVGGILDGHWSGHVSWFDEYDPVTNTWKTLTDAPHARDHFHAVIAGTKIFVAGGRRSSYSTGQTFALTVPEVDVYDFSTSKWTTLPAASNIPTPRAGSGNVMLNGELLVIGGESPQPTAHKETEALNITTNSWRRLADLQQGRHGTQAIENNGGIYIVTGAGNQGGSPLLTSQEAFYFSTTTTPTGTALTQSKLTAPASVDFGQVGANSSNTKTLTLTNGTGNQAIVISSITKSGDASFGYTVANTLPLVIPAGGSLNVTVNFTAASGSKTGSIAFAHSGSGATTTVSLTGSIAVANATLYRINSGGEAVTIEGVSWAADNFFNGGKSYSNAKITQIANTNSDQLYLKERSSATPFGYAFPVANGTYKVNLHFAEIYWGATGGGEGEIGKRVFDVNIEGGAIELANFDIYQEAGAMTALVKTFTIPVTDGQLNIDFAVKTDQPKISAIEIVQNVETDITATPASLYFFSQQAGTTSAAQTVTLKNTTTSSKQITAITLTGANKTEFKHDFSAAVTLAAGATKIVNVSFAPGSLGTKVAQLSVAYSSSATPLSIGLTGEGIANPNLVPVADAGVDRTLTQPLGSVRLNGSGTDRDGTIERYAWTQVSGPNTAVFDSKKIARPTLTNLIVGSYVFSLVVVDNLGASSSADNVTLTIQANASAAGSLSGLVLLNADTNIDIQNLIEGTTLNLNSLPNHLNIKALTAPSIVGSVVFNLRGAATRNQVETESPYALFGDTDGNYNNWTPVIGNYSLTATSYSKGGGTGVAGTPLVINFKVVKPATTRLAAGNTDSSLVTINIKSVGEDVTSNTQDLEDATQVYPNPASERIYLNVIDWTVIKSVTIHNISGRKMFYSEKAAELSNGISVREWTSGLYVIQLQNIEDKVASTRVVVVK